MPDVAFIATLRIDDLSTLADVAADIQDDLEEKGYDVKSVAPCARPALTQGGINPLPNVPTTNQQTTQQQNEPII